MEQFGSSKRLCCCYINTGQLWTGFVTLACILYYYISSSLIILYNKWLFSKFAFHCPISVTSIHMATSFLCAAMIQRFRTGSFSIGASRTAIMRTIAIGLMVGTDIALSNTSYMFVSIPFMEMVKSASPLWVLLLSLTVKIEQFSLFLAGSFLFMSAGLCLSVYGEAKFSVPGFAMCLTASVLAALRVVLSHTVLHAPVENKMDPIQILYVMAPTCAIAMAPVGLALELQGFLESKFTHDPELGREAGMAIAAGAFLAVNLNLSEFVLLGRTSAMTMCVAGVFKVVMVSLASVAIFHNKITSLNGVGFAICMCGVIGYNYVKWSRSQQDKTTYTTVEFGQSGRTAATSDTALLNYVKNEIDAMEYVDYEDDFDDLDNMGLLDDVDTAETADSKSLLRPQDTR